MIGSPVQIGSVVTMEAGQVQVLLDALKRHGYRLLGPTLHQGDLIYGEIAAVADLPLGLADVQQGGAFHWHPREDQALFGYGVGQHSWKQFLSPPRQLLWEARRDGQGFHLHYPEEEAPNFAFIGVRPCDLHAMAVQDKVLLAGPHVDRHYQARRAGAFIVAVNCGGRSCGTGFCVSMGTGPKAASGFDLSLTEMPGVGNHYLLVEVGTHRGAEVIRELPHRSATPREMAAADRRVAATAAQIGRELATGDLQEMLYRSYDHPHWDDVAARCLNCGNCTAVCPTCFCHTMEDVTDLTGTLTQRWRRRDVCYTVDFSYIHGGSIRATPRSRYRQWLTHKLATWLDQFGCLGCVGCGRCITWCPVAIDLTAEVRALRETEASLKEKHDGNH